MRRAIIEVLSICFLLQSTFVRCDVIVLLSMIYVVIPVSGYKAKQILRFCCLKAAFESSTVTANTCSNIYPCCILTSEIEGNSTCATTAAKKQPRPTHSNSPPRWSILGITTKPKKLASTLLQNSSSPQQKEPLLVQCYGETELTCITRSRNTESSPK